MKQEVRILAQTILVLRMMTANHVFLVQQGPHSQIVMISIEDPWGKGALHTATLESQTTQANPIRDRENSTPLAPFVSMTLGF